MLVKESDWKIYTKWIDINLGSMGNQTNMELVIQTDSVKDR